MGPWPRYGVYSVYSPWSSGPRISNDQSYYFQKVRRQGGKQCTGVNDLLDKEVFDQDTGEKLASVKEVIFDEDTRQVVALLVDGGLLQDAGVVKWGSVANVADVVALRGGEAPHDLGSDPEVSELRRCSDKAEGKEIVTEGGEKIGEVSDLFIGESGKVLGYEVKSGLVRDLTGRKFLPIEKVHSSGEDAVVATDAELPSVDDIEQVT